MSKKKATVIKKNGEPVKATYNIEDRLLRTDALAKAVAISTPDDDVGAIVVTAEAFYKFLKGE